MASTPDGMVNNGMYASDPPPTSQAQVSTAHSQSWCSKRTSLEKALIVVLLISLAVSIILIIVVAIQKDSSRLTGGTRDKTKCTSADCVTPDGDTESTMCLTADCVRTASRILEAMDQTVDPCEDFFEYACGTWNKKNVIPDDRSSYNTFGKLRDDLQVTLKGLLETPIMDSEPEAVTNAKHLYQSCLNMSQIEDRGDQPLRDFLEEFGGWPVLNPLWDETTFDWLDVVSRLRRYNNRILINQWVSSDDRDSSVNIIQLDQSQLGMPSRDYFLRGRDDHQLMAYQKFATDIALLLGADEERARREMEEVIDFEIALANITVPEEERRDTEALYNRMTIGDLYTNISQDVDWLRYMNDIFGEVGLTFDIQEEVVVYAVDYMKNMANLVQSTPKRTLANYLLWPIIMLRVSNLPKRFLDIRREFIKALFGTDSDRARWRTCVSYVDNHYGMAVGRLFLKDNFDESAKKSALEMIHNIREAFKELLEEVPWMDEDTRTVAREKAEAITEKIGYPEYILNATALNLDYDGVIMDPTKYFENTITMLKLDTRLKFTELRKPVDKDKWSTTPIVVNAFYSAPKNQIMFPAAILQPPFYHPNYPKSLNYGGIAMVIGHEITHSLDDKGRQFDKDGNLKQWWTNAVIERFKDKAQCIIDQYGNYTVPEVDMNLNGKNTQGENIADNGGLKQAFRAYRSWVARQGKEEDALPGVNLTHDQLFFLNFAQIWCGTARPENYIQAISSGRHSPGRFRVVGSLSNSVEFAKAYECRSGSKMNPTHKCSVW